MISKFKRTQNLVRLRRKVLNTIIYAITEAFSKHNETIKKFIKNNMDYTFENGNHIYTKKEIKQNAAAKI